MSEITIPVDAIMRVYSGKANTCACGCAGNYSYASKHRALGTKYRGYAVEDDEVSDRNVSRIFNILKRNMDKLVIGSNNMHVTLGNRIYVVYPVSWARG